MRAAIAQAIFDASENNGLELQLIDDYSGRGMFGKSTHAISGSESEFRSACCHASAAIALLGTEESEIFLEEFCDEVGGFRTDNMGRTNLVWY